jgi:hypothetical protein
MGACPGRITNRRRENEREALVFQERQFESAHSPRTMIAFNSDKRRDRSTLGNGSPHKNMQPNPRQHVDYRTDRIVLSKNAKNTRHDAVNKVMNRAATMINLRDPASSRLSSPAHIELEYVLARSSAKTPQLAICNHYSSRELTRWKLVTKW